jgi:two-component system, OmpR family, response regulator QseB
VTILLVDDDVLYARAIARALQPHDVVVEHSAAAAVIRARDLDTQLIVLDKGLPDGDGVELCALLRSLGVRMPILILTADDELRVQLAAYRAGADEYISKSTDVDVVRAKVDAHLRPRPAHAVRRVGPIALYEHRRTVVVHDHPVELSWVELEILLILMHHLDQILDGDHIAALVWGPSWQRERATLASRIRHLTEKLGPRSAAYFSLDGDRGWMLRSRPLHPPKLALLRG